MILKQRQQHFHKNPVGHVQRQTDKMSVNKADRLRLKQRQTDRQPDWHTDKKTEQQIDRQTDIHINRKIGKKNEQIKHRLMSSELASHNR